MIGLAAFALIQAATSPAATDPASKVRCVRIEETGSFVRKKRVCHTEAEWRMLERRDNTELDRMRDRTPINSQRPVG